jgi:hypothetical protein
MPGWRCSADRARLRVNSLLTGNLTGNISISGHSEAILEQETAALQGLFAKFPIQTNREIISGNRDF